MSQRDEIKNALTMGRKLENMGNLMNGVLVAGNELNEVDTLKSLAKTAVNSGELVGEIIGSGVLANVEELAENVYTETIEMLALYLATLVDGESSNEDDELDEDEDELDEDEDGLDEDEDGLDEDEDGLDEDEDGLDEDEDELVCTRCGEVEPDGAGWIGDRYVCYNCMSVNEYKGR